MDGPVSTEAVISATSAADQHVQYKVELHRVNLNGTLQPINGPIFVGDDIVSKFIRVFKRFIKKKHVMSDHFGFTEKKK